jgi:hypothetical protein
MTHVFTSPREARRYIDLFRHLVGGPVVQVTISTCETIPIATMTDRQAILVADGLLQFEMEVRRGQLQ